MSRVRRGSRTGWSIQTWPVRLTRGVIVGKAVVTSGVGLVEYLAAPIVQRSTWGSIRAFEPRWLGMALMMWGLSDMLWQASLGDRFRRAWWYCVLSSGGVVAASKVVSANASSPGVLAGALAVSGLIAVIFLLVFRHEFEAR